MEIRVLEYFLTVAREENITRAAEVLHMTQPPLSRQMKDLEKELGKELFLRGNRKITLTEEGMILRRRAEEILELMSKTKAEISSSDEDISGDLHIGGGETEGIRRIAKVLRRLQAEHPKIRVHIFSGQAEDVTERLDRGLLDFGLLIEPAELTKYDYLKLPTDDIWGLLMRKDSPLAKQAAIRPRDLIGLPLIVSNQALVENEFSGWLGGKAVKMEINATYNLLYNASLMVEEGVGYALCLDKIVGTGTGSPLCFRPLEPKIIVGHHLVWKKYQIFSKPAAKFLSLLQEEIIN